MKDIVRSASSEAPHGPGPVVLAGSVEPGGWGRPASPAEVARHARALGVVVAHVHATAVDAPAGGYREALVARCAGALRALDATPLDPGEDGPALLRWVEERATEPPTAALVHGALGPDAVRLGDDGSVGLTGWSHTRFDDPWADLAPVALLPAPVRAAFAAGYGSAPTPGPRLDALVGGVVFDQLATALDPEASPADRAACLATFRTLSRALRAGQPASPPSLGATRAELLLARLRSAPPPDLALLARWCVAATAVEVRGPVPGFDALVAGWSLGARATLPARDLAPLLADPLRPGVDLRLAFAAAVTRVEAAAGGSLEAPLAGGLGALHVPGPADPSTTALYGTLARGALGVLDRLRPELRPQLAPARAQLDEALAQAGEALGLSGWRTAGWSTDPSPLLAALDAPLGFLGPLVADAVLSGADALPVAALLRVLGSELPDALREG